jgi:hypothetical protein
MLQSGRKMREGEKNLLLEEESAQKDIHITRF